MSAAWLGAPTFSVNGAEAYNSPMFARRDSNYGYWLLNVAAFVTLAAVALGTLLEIETQRTRLLAAAGFALFGVLIAFCLQLEGRPRLMHGYLLAQGVIVVALVTLAPQAADNTQTLFFILAAQSMLFLPIFPAVLWIILFSVVEIAGFAYYFGLAGNLGVLTVLGGHLFFGTFGAALRQANRARQESQRLLGELREANEQLRASSRQAQQLAVAEERNRLAREMHDALGHRLTVAVVQLEGAQRLIPDDPARAAAIVGTMRGQLKSALAELRQTVSTLRHAGEDSMPPGLVGESLAAAITHLVQTFQEATGLPVDLSLPLALPELPAEHRLALYRAAQESLTNVQRHAGAGQAWLALAVDEGCITLTVADDGQGFAKDVGNGRFGLQGLRERAGALAGGVELARSAHGGAEVRFSLPLAGAGEAGG